ncbi:fringe-like family related protein [Cyclospora cayetanensis]|uniref:Fringe-like family related protein n=1 Tax=Cyclospora cayetanensis TaxID=88456 RepID=A0A1D3D9Z5_9EIME|nr:fringe-like family related protein [Cyclospora cayetanensis]
MACWFRRLLPQPLLMVVVLLLIASSQRQRSTARADDSAANGVASDIPRGPPPQTMIPSDASLPLLQTKTAFLIDLEPVIESHIVSNLLHQLLFSLRIPQDRVKLRDEAFMLSSPSNRRQAASLGRWLVAEAATLPQQVEFIFVCSAYTRITPGVLEALLREILHKARGESLGPFILGWGLTDQKSTILHHFEAPNSLVYPHLDAGTLWSRAALDALKIAVLETPPAVSIEKDFVYELFVHLKKTQQLQLLHSELFCPAAPLVEDYERAQNVYPPPHTLPKKLAGFEASAAANNRELSSAESTAAAAGRAVADLQQSCAAYSSGTRHAPVLSHQMFDGLIDFDEELIQALCVSLLRSGICFFSPGVCRDCTQVQREKLADRFPPDERDIEGGPYQKALEELEKTRPAFIVDPQARLLAPCRLNKRSMEGKICVFFLRFPPSSVKL